MSSAFPKISFNSSVASVSATRLGGDIDLVPLAGQCLSLHLLRLAVTVPLGGVQLHDEDEERCTLLVGK